MTDITESTYLLAGATKTLADLLGLYKRRETSLQCEEKMLLDEKGNWELEKNKIATTYHFENNEIMLDIGGHSFTTTLTTLQRFPETMIGAMFSGRHNLKKNEAGSYFIDRDGTHFRHILNFLRSPERFLLHFQLSSESNFFKELEFEAEFYGLAEMMFHTSPVIQEILDETFDGGLPTSGLTRGDY